MRRLLVNHRWVTLVALLVCAAAAGCTNDVVEQIIDIPVANVDGTWNYQLNNPDQATFTNCTGAAILLEGQTWNQALALAPICHVASSFQVTQNLAALFVVPHNVTCSDGSSAVVTGAGAVTDTTVNGQWDSTSNQNVNANQGFQGTVSGSTITLTEDHRDFSGGGLQGSCDISPPLSATVTVQ